MDPVEAKRERIAPRPGRHTIHGFDASAVEPGIRPINFTLGTIFSTQPGASGAFESIEREGTIFIAPWAGGSQSLSQSVIRMSSTSGASGAVTVTLTNAFQTGNVAIADDTCTFDKGVPADGDLVINQAALTECFGSFARGDLMITVEGAPESLTAKMRHSNSTGTFESTLGRYSGATIAGATSDAPRQVPDPA